MRLFRLELIGLIAATTLSGCSLLAADWAAVNPTPRPLVSPSDASPGSSSSPWPDGTAFVDEESGLELTLPSNWRVLAVGDPGWVMIYGDHASAAETSVADGGIQDFAVPLYPRDPDTAVNLAVYVQTLPASSTLRMLADAYQGVLQSEHVTGIAREDVTLPAGSAIRRSGLRGPSPGINVSNTRLVAYLLVANGRGYHLVFASDEATMDDYSAEFLRIAMSARATTSGGHAPASAAASFPEP